MTTPISFSTAKLLKEKGFNEECEFFYSRHGSLDYLKPHREYEHLHSYSNLLVSYFDGKYDWNSLDVDEGMIALKTAFSESDGYVNCECSAPTIAEVVMWLYEKREVWVSVIKSFTKQDFWCAITTNDKTYGINGCSFNSPTEAYKTAIDYTLNNLI